MNKPEKNIQITELKEMINPIAKEFKFKLAVLFGSASSGWLREWSNLDIDLIYKIIQ